MEIYLTKLSLNPRNSLVRKCLGDCHKLHSLVMQGFPNVDGEKAEVRKKFGVLHRLEVNVKLGIISLLVQSAFKPVWNFTDDVLSDEGFSQKEIGHIYSILPNETELMFRIRANPTKCVSVKNTDFARFAGKRVELRTSEDQIEWLKRKSEQHGFRLTAVKVNSEVENVATTPNGKVFGNHSKGKLTFNSVIFDGNLKITDAEKFKEALIHGIGQGKAYGFGLLSIAKSLSF
jgi:CRISPR system Cascade subunit CasE